MPFLEGVAVTGALHEPVGAVYGLAKSVIQELHYLRKNRYSNSYDKLIASGIPANALLVRNAAFQGLSAHGQHAVVTYLLSGRPMAQARDAGFTQNTAARNVLMQAYLAYHGDPANPAANPGLTAEQQARVNAFLVTNCDIPRAAFDPNRAAYNALPNQWQRDAVDRIARMRKPGSKEYEELREYNYKAWKLVADRNERQRRVQDDLRSFGHFFGDTIKIVPLPGTSGIGNLINHWVDKAVERATGPDYHKIFDPDRKTGSMEILNGDNGDAAAKKIEFEMQEIIKGAQSRFKDIKKGIRDKLNGTWGDYHYFGGILADAADEHNLQRVLLNKEADLSDLTFQMQHSIDKAHDFCEEFKKNLKKHIKEIITSGQHDYKTAYKDALGIFFGKMINESAETEPIIGTRLASAAKL